MNQIVLLGRMTKDPELRYSQNGTAVARFVLAVNRDNSDKTDFIYCVTFGKQAESTAQYCRKGRQVLLSGRLEINVTKNEESNEYQNFTNVVANRIEFLAIPGQNQQQNINQPQQQEPQPQTGYYQQQRFQPGPNGWSNPADTEVPF